MKRIAGSLLSLTLILSLFPVHVYAEEPESVPSPESIAERINQTNSTLDDEDLETSEISQGNVSVDEAAAEIDRLQNTESDLDGQVFLNQIKPIFNRDAASINSEYSNWTRIALLMQDITEYGYESSEGQWMINGTYYIGSLENTWAIFFIEQDFILRFFNYIELNESVISCILDLDVNDIDYPYMTDTYGFTMDTDEYSTVAIPTNFDISTYTANQALNFSAEVTDNYSGAVAHLDNNTSLNTLGSSIFDASVKSWKNAVYEWEGASMNDFGFEVYDGATLPVTVDRIAGKSRFDTSMRIADAYKAEMGIDKFESIILTSGLNFADALAGSYLSYKKNAPILITADEFGTSKPYKDVNSYIKANLKSGGTIYVLGGTGAVSETALSGLGSYNVVRLSGKGRFETNIEILKEAGVKDEEILVATGYNFADSLSASAVNRPILLVGDELNEDQLAYLDTLNTKQFYILGGTGAVKATVETQLKARGAAVKRLSGKGRHETSVLIAEEFCADAERIVIAYSFNFPDGLCAGPLASAVGGPLILSATGQEAAAHEYCSFYELYMGYVIGGEGLINNKAVNTIIW